MFGVEEGLGLCLIEKVFPILRGATKGCSAFALLKSGSNELQNPSHSTGQSMAQGTMIPSANRNEKGHHLPLLSPCRMLWPQSHTVQPLGPGRTVGHTAMLCPWLGAALALPGG